MKFMRNDAGWCYSNKWLHLSHTTHTPWYKHLRIGMFYIGGTYCWLEFDIGLRAFQFICVDKWFHTFKTETYVEYDDENI